MLKNVIYNYWDSELPRVIERDIKIDVKSELINDIVGIRRAGKSYLMFWIIKKLLKRVDKKATIYINFENRRLFPLTPDYFNQIISFIYEEQLLAKRKKIYLFLDEVQRIKGWEMFIRSIYDEFKGRIKIFVSGSSANLLSQEYGKLLTGRHLTFAVFPLSFREFLRFKNFKLEILSEEKIAELKRLLKEYLEFGGFPEVVLLKTKKRKEHLLNQLFSDILSRDVLSRAEVRREGIIEDFAYYLTSNISSLLSFNKMAGHFHSRGIKISVSTLENYFYLLKNSFLFFETKIFSYKVKDQLQYPRKVYCLDNGLVNLAGFRFSQNIGKLYENIVAIELFRRFFVQPNIQIFYWRNQMGQEVDFLIKQGAKIRQIVQVCYEINDPETKKREIRSLIKASQELKCRNLLVITENEEKREKEVWRGVKREIKFVPLWKWLMG